MEFYLNVQFLLILSRFLVISFFVEFGIIRPNVPTFVAVACDLRLNLTNPNPIVVDSGFSAGKNQAQAIASNVC